MFRIAAFVLAFFTLCTAGYAQEQAYTIAEGKLEGSLYKIAVPKTWNKKLLLLAHGALREKAPLSADFEIEKTYVGELLKEGWLVAGTSYRRNGIFVTDGLADIVALYEHTVKEYGRPEKTYLAGWSMGGNLAVKLAEEAPGRFNGALAVGAALLCDDNGTSSEKNIGSYKKLAFKPNIPVLFLSNVNETKWVRNYAELAVKNKADAAVWTAVRRGHCNVNDAETLKALRALAAWAEKGLKPADETVSIDTAREASTARREKSRLYARISHADPAYGNLTADVSRSDLTAAGIKQDTYFYVGFKDRKFKVYLGYHYADVKKGKWIAFVTAEDFLRLAMNWANAQKALGCKDGDEIYLESITGA